jgi:hypothetical protein
MGMTPVQRKEHNNLLQKAYTNAATAAEKPGPLSSFISAEKDTLEEHAKKLAAALPEVESNSDVDNLAKLVGESHKAQKQNFQAKLDSQQKQELNGEPDPVKKKALEEKHKKQVTAANTYLDSLEKANATYLAAHRMAVNMTPIISGGHRMVGGKLAVEGVDAIATNGEPVDYVVPMDESHVDPLYRRVKLPEFTLPKEHNLAERVKGKGANFKLRYDPKTKNASMNARQYVQLSKPTPKRAKEIAALGRGLSLTGSPQTKAERIKAIGAARRSEEYGGLITGKKSGQELYWTQFTQTMIQQGHSEITLNASMSRADKLVAVRTMVLQSEGRLSFDKEFNDLLTSAGNKAETAEVEQLRDLHKFQAGLTAQELADLRTEAKAAASGPAASDPVASDPAVGTKRKASSGATDLIAETERLKKQARAYSNTAAVHKVNNNNVSLKAARSAVTDLSTKIDKKYISPHAKPEDKEAYKRITESPASLTGADAEVRVAKALVANVKDRYTKIALAREIAATQLVDAKEAYDKLEKARNDGELSSLECQEQQAEIVNEMYSAQEILLETDAVLATLDREVQAFKDKISEEVLESADYTDLDASAAAAKDDTHKDMTAKVSKLGGEMATQLRNNAATAQGTLDAVTFKSPDEFKPNDPSAPSAAAAASGPSA